MSGKCSGQGAEPLRSSSPTWGPCPRAGAWGRDADLIMRADRGPGRGLPALSREASCSQGNPGGKARVSPHPVGPPLGGKHGDTPLGGRVCPSLQAALPAGPQSPRTTPKPQEGPSRVPSLPPPVRPLPRGSSIPSPTQGTLVSHILIVLPGACPAPTHTAPHPRRHTLTASNITLPPGDKEKPEKEPNSQGSGLKRSLGAQGPRWALHARVRGGGGRRVNERPGTEAWD